MTQIDGNPAPETCVVQCAYQVDTPATVPGAGGTFAAYLRRTSGSCEWIALSESPWITLARPITGGDRSALTYNVAANTGAARTGWIRFVYPGGITYLEVRQGAPSGVTGFQFFDPATSTNPVTECAIRTTSTTVPADPGRRWLVDHRDLRLVCRVRVWRHQGSDPGRCVGIILVHRIVRHVAG